VSEVTVVPSDVAGTSIVVEPESVLLVPLAVEPESESAVPSEVELESEAAVPLEEELVDPESAAVLVLSSSNRMIGAKKIEGLVSFGFSVSVDSGT
jgi:hypothetical protein